MHISYIYIHIHTPRVPKEQTSPLKNLHTQQLGVLFQHLPTILPLVLGDKFPQVFGSPQGPSCAEHGHDDLPVKSPPHVGRVDVPESLCRHARFPGRRRNLGFVIFVGDAGKGISQECQSVDLFVDNVRRCSVHALRVK